MKYLIRALLALVPLLAGAPVIAQTTDRIEGITAGVAIKAPVKAVAETNITLYGEQTIDGTAVVEGDRVLVMGQTDAVENGIYNVGSTAWGRASDFDGARDVVQGTIVLPQGNGVYQVTSADPITIGTSEINFALRIMEQEQIVSVTDFGIVANSVPAATDNITALRALLSTTTNGGSSTFAGQVIFPNAGGSDIYYFDPLFTEVRNGISIDCQGATLDFSGAYDADNDLRGFLTFISDVTVENCNFNIDYDGSAGTNNGHAIRIGMRGSYPFGALSGEEEDIAYTMANNVVRNVRITTNNPTHVVVAMGGLQNTTIENVVIDGTDLAHHGIYYEFGHWHYIGDIGVGGSGNITTHALNFRLKNIRVSNLAATFQAVGITGAMTAFVDGLWADDTGGIFIARVGEAFYYNMTGTPTEGMSHQAHYDLRGLYGKNLDTNGISLLGAQAYGTGYLAEDLAALGAEAEAIAQTDLISFNLDGFSVQGGSISLAGRHVRLANGEQNGLTTFGGSGGILMQDELRSFEFDNIRVLDNLDLGIRSQTGTNIWTVARFKSGSIRNSFVAGNGRDANEAGIALSNSDGVLIDTIRCGYEAVHDGVAEADQGACVSNGATAFNTTVRNSYGGGTAAAAMYANAGSGGWKFAKLESVGGVKTLSGQWTIDGNGVDDDLGDAAETLNVGTDLPTKRYASTVDTTRAVTCSETGARRGDRFEVIRTGGGAGDIVVCGLATIATGETGRVVVLFEDDNDDGNGDWRLVEHSIFP